MAEDFTRLKGGYEISEIGLTEATEINMIDFFSWGILGIGGYTNVYRNSSGAYGANLSTLRLVNEPNYASGRVFEGFRSNWVWETGVERQNPPIQISGVYVNNSFYSTSTTGAYSYKINYPLGRVVFDTPIATTSTVQVEHSFKKVSIVSSRSRVGKNLMFNSYRPDNNGFNTVGSGLYNTLAQSRIQLPCIVVKVVDNGNHVPMEIGGGYFTTLDTLFYIFAEDSSSVETLKSICLNQIEKTIYFYNKTDLVTANKHPLTYQGSINPSGYLCYSQLVDPPSPHGSGFRWKRCFIKKIRSQDDNVNPSLQSAIVRFTLEIDCPEL